MKIEKLFNVLVIGGALLGGQSLPLTAMEPVTTESLEALAEDELKPIFCTSEEACPMSACGHRKVKEGFECCWGTSCENVP